MQIYAIIILYNAFDGGILHRKKKKALNITTHQPILGVRYPDGVTCGGTQHLVNYRLVDMGWANVCTARSRGSQHDAMLSGVTLRDGNDRRVFMQNFKSWYLMSGSEQTRICSTSLQMVPHLLRTYSRTSWAAVGVPTTQRPCTWITSRSCASMGRRVSRVPDSSASIQSRISWCARSFGMPGIRGM